MRIAIVCGKGIGTSILLKMTAEKALRALEVSADVEVADLASAHQAMNNCDVILTSRELVDSLTNVKARVVVIDNFVDPFEVREKLAFAIGENSQNED